MFMAGSYWNVRCSVRVHYWQPHPPGCCMLRSLCNYSYINFWPTANDSQHRGTKGQAKKPNWKFEDAGFKRWPHQGYYQRLDSILDVAPAGLLRVNRGVDANSLNDLLTFMSNAILKSGKEIFGMQKPSKFNEPGWNESKGGECSIEGISEILEYWSALEKWSTCWA